MQKNTIKIFILSYFLLVPPIGIQAFSFTDSANLFNINLNLMIKPEAFAASRATLLDNNVSYDLFWFIRHTADIMLSAIDTIRIIEFSVVLRNKTVWGNYGSVGKTSKSTIKLIDTVTGDHNHALLRNYFHARELWLRIDISKIFCMPINTSHFLTIGSFPFQLGRGIALGDAFAVGPETLGFYSDTAVDQFAYGLLFSGDICKDVAKYSLYFELVETKTDSFASTGEKVRAQQYGRQKDPERGFGVLNYIVAGNVNWYVFISEQWGSLRFQPYWLFNESKEQTVEFPGDASSRLGTLGLECEYLGPKVEFGIEGACNLGAQYVRGWDRDAVVFKAPNGLVAQMNSHVVDSTGANIPFISNGDAQNAIFAVPQTEAENGKQIPGDFPMVGFFEPLNGEIFNSKNRFRDPYQNTYKGWMLVSDASWWVYKKDVRISATVAYASGDDNPNFDTMDRDFTGFIGLQELYSGTRVKSAFLLGGAGKVVRPIANPIDVETSNVLTKTVSGFTNLIFGGLGVSWTPSNWEKPFKLNPNILVYWQDKTVPIFVLAGPAPRASRYLGVEANVFIECNIAKNLKLFCVSSVFVPGTFFKDIAGRRADQALLDQEDLLDVTGFTKDTVPKFGHDTAFTFNAGLEYRF
ncbi:MAG TPA: hypothetical protein VGW78_04505 [Candidatus Babeliales bacterium]|nr:hypothetical protein [Candidatus Babeliales bacterium]